MTWLFGLLHNVVKFRFTLISLAECNWEHRPVFCFQDARFMWPHKFLSYTQFLRFSVRLITFHFIVSTKLCNQLHSDAVLSHVFHCSLCCLSCHWTITVHMNFSAVWQAIECAIYVEIVKFVTRSNTTWIRDAVCSKGLEINFSHLAFFFNGAASVQWTIVIAICLHHRPSKPWAESMTLQLSVIALNSV